MRSVSRSRVHTTRPGSRSAPTAGGSHGADDPFVPRLQMRDAHTEGAEVEEMHEVGF
jgi:hypothetical protein